MVVDCHLITQRAREKKKNASSFEINNKENLHQTMVDDTCLRCNVNNPKLWIFVIFSQVGGHYMDVAILMGD